MCVYAARAETSLPLTAVTAALQSSPIPTRTKAESQKTADIMAVYLTKKKEKKNLLFVLVYQLNVRHFLYILLKTQL